MYNYKKKSAIILLPLFLLVYLASCSVQKYISYIDELSNERAIFSADNRLERIASLWTGHFSNKQVIQEGTTTTEVEQELIGRRVWQKKRPGEYWMYIGWFHANSYEKALSSGLAQITRISPDTSFMTFNRFASPESIPVFEWTKDQPFEDLTKEDLILAQEGCGSFIVSLGKNKYEMIAHKACFDPMSDLVQYFKINCTLSPKGILFNTLFLDKNKEVTVYYKDNRFDRFNKKELEEKYERTVLTSGS